MNALELITLKTEKHRQIAQTVQNMRLEKKLK